MTATTAATNPRQTLAMINSKLSWKQDLRPNSYCTDVCHQQTTIVPQKMFPNLESHLTQIQKKYVISNAFCKNKLKNRCYIKSTMSKCIQKMQAKNLYM